MIHPLIDINKPIRLTTYGEKLFPEVINNEAVIASVEMGIDINDDEIDA